MSVRRPKCALALLAICAGVGCASGTETGNPDESTRLTLGARPGSTPVGLTLSEARVSLPSLSFTSCGPEAGRLRMPEAVDLLSSSGERAPLDRVTALACGATVELGPSTLAAPAALAGLTVLFRGTREDGVLFELRSTVAQHLVLVTAPPDTAFDASRLFLAFDVGVWLDAAGIPDLTPVGGAVAVDASHEPGALAAFDAASAHAVALYFDANGDGRLTDAELTPVAIPE